MPPAKTPALTTTSYAILGLLAVKPWTTYELAQQMRRALGQFWPRAESKLYEEPKKLVAHGLARATKETTGKRPRTVYSITPRGQRAMAAWVPEPAAGPVLEFEGLVKLFYAEHGTKRDVLATLDQVRTWSDEQHHNSVGISQSYLDGEGAFPNRLPWLILCGQFLEEFTIMVEHWTEWATGVVEQWPDDISKAEPAFDVLRAQARRSEIRSSRSEA
ncbi:MAG: putative PadR family transcriptional regulator [Frankiales bacterium]|nr:putative PadR family transcriptional regulator [Frankiales bacterium]